jgi:2-phosphosulfolactate phosphatase
MKKTFVVDYLPESARRYKAGWAVVAVDVIRATTLAVTAVSLGRRCYPVDSIESAKDLARRFENPLLAGEVKGDMPQGFDMNNSPSELAVLDDARPLIMLSSSGTRLLANACDCDELYVSCFRNSDALAERLAEGEHSRIALIGAGSRGEFREEDQIGCAWLGKRLLQAGYVPKDDGTSSIVARWGSAKASDCIVSRSVNYLRRTNQMADLDFILDHVNDLAGIFVLRQGEVVTDTVSQATWTSHLVPVADAL